MRKKRKKSRKASQYIISILSIIIVAALCTLLTKVLGYKAIALVLLMTVSVLAVLLDIMPVLLAAFLSALAWNFFFIPPRFTLNIHSTEDVFLLLMYFIVAMINAVLTHRIKIAERKAQEKEGKTNTIKLYNTLLNSLSHELRTPIATIIGSTDNLQTNANGLTEKDKSDLLSEISIAALRLNQQVENLLNMSRLESGHFQIRKDWCDVNELVHTTIQQLSPVLSKHKVSVYMPDQLPLFKLDFGLMEQVLYNLTNNAIFHTPENSTITIQADCIDDKLVITVADNGSGFPEDGIQNAFEKFYRVPGSRPGGTGLGLSIAKGFVEAHNGIITLKNLPVCGAVFTIEIPTEISYLNRLKNE